MPEKLFCGFDPSAKTKIEMECGTCNTCMPYSNLVYPFHRDLKNSEMLVEELKSLINGKTSLIAKDTTTHKNPDIEVFNEAGKLVCRVEAKYLSGKAFMKVNQLLADNLLPKETLVVDEPKLLSYFEVQDRDREDNGGIPLYVVWKYDRPCADVGGICVYQEVSILRKIYNERGNRRKFTRRTGMGDYSGGRRMGVIDKFHYSLRECKPIESFVNELKDLE